MPLKGCSWTLPHRTYAWLRKQHAIESDSTGTKGKQQGINGTALSPLLWCSSSSFFRCFLISSELITGGHSNRDETMWYSYSGTLDPLLGVELVHCLNGGFVTSRRRSRLEHVPEKLPAPVSVTCPQIMLLTGTHTRHCSCWQRSPKPKSTPPVRTPGPPEHGAGFSVNSSCLLRSLSWNFRRRCCEEESILHTSCGDTVLNARYKMDCLGAPKLNF